MRIILAILIWAAAASFAPAAITVTPGGGGGVITTNEFDGSAITSGTVADARIASTIARDSEVPGIMATNIQTLVSNKSDYYRGPRAQAVDCIVSIDLGLDFGDASAQYLINHLQDSGELNVLGYVTPMTNNFAAPAVEVINRAFGRGHIPVGQNKATSAYNGGDYFGSYLANNYYNIIGNRTNALADTNILRVILADRPDASVTFLILGQWTNIKRLYDSPADSISPLTGAQLIAQKVKRFVVMGGDYPTGNEFNFNTDPASALVVNNLYTNGARMSFVGYTLPLLMPVGGLTGTLTAKSPLYGAWTNYVGNGGTASRPCWDELAVWYAARGATYQGTTYFTVTNRGFNTATASGSNYWTYDDVDHGQEYVATNAVSAATITNTLNAMIVADPLAGSVNSLSVKGGEVKSLTLTGPGIFSQTNYMRFIYASNGSASFPSISFAGNPAMGFYNISGVAVGLVVGGAERARFFSSYLDLKSDTKHRWSSLNLGDTADVEMGRVSAGVIGIGLGAAYCDLKARTVTSTNLVLTSVAIGGFVQPASGGVSLVASNGYLFSIHNVSGTFTTNLLKAP